MSPGIISRTTLKLFLIIFNILWLICGLICITLGSYIYNKNGVFLLDLENVDTPDYAIYIILIGIITFIMSIVGCWGAIRESQGITMVYLATLLTLIVVEITVACVLYPKLHAKTVEKMINNYINNMFTNEEHYNLVDTIQASIKCCGTNGYHFWKQSIPVSCCPDYKPCEENQIFNVGCGEKIIKFIVDHKSAIASSALTFGIVELIAFVVSCILAKDMAN